MTQQDKPRSGLDSTAVLQLIVSHTVSLNEDFAALEMVSIDPALDVTSRKAVMTQYADRIQERIAAINMQTERLQTIATTIVSSAQ